MKKNLEIDSLLKMLPHRYPFILIDRVIELIPGERIKALKNVSANEPCFAGHFPDNPVMPGVLILEAMAQTGCVLVSGTREGDFQKSPLLLTGLDKVRLRKKVIPGDQLIIEMKFLKQRSNLIKMSGTVSVDGDVVAEAVVMASTGE